MNSTPLRGWGRHIGTRTIVHLDMDAFFAQIETLDNPEYAGKPLVVGGRRDATRGVVSTCNYEARRYGIHSAMPIQRAVALCPHAIFVPGRMARYEAVSKQIRTVLDTFSPMVEPLSIDEAFLDMTGTEHLYTDARDMGQQIKQAVLARTGLTGSVGIAGNKFLAKLTSDMDKPDGLFVLPAANVDALLLTLPVEALWGVGPQTAALLHKHGWKTVRHLRRASAADLAAIVGQRLADHLLALAVGHDARPVEPHRQPKSMGRELTFAADVPDGRELRAHLARLTATVGWQLRQSGLYARTVTVKIRHPDFATHTKSRSLTHPIHDDNTLYRESCALLDAFALQRPLRLLGMYASQLQTTAQTDLFDEPDEDRLSTVLDTLHERFGHRAVRRGREL